MLLVPTGMEKRRCSCLQVSNPLALMPICLQTVAAAPLVVEIKMNCSSAASLTHSCASVALLAPSVSSWSVTACCDVSAVVSSLGNTELMSPAYAVKRYFHSSNWE